MPRDGSGAGDNAIEAGHNIVHGEPSENEVCFFAHHTTSTQTIANLISDSQKPTASGVDRSSKAAPPPEGEEGAALEGMNASGGGAKTEGSGKGPIEGESTVEKVAKGEA